MSHDQIKTIRELKERYPYQFTPKTYELGLTHGWFYVFVQLCKDVDALLATRPGSSFTWRQVKEKFGTCRIHFAASKSAHQDEALGQLVLAASNKTVNMCICCGKSGSMDSTGGYMLTLCPEHAAVRRVDPRASLKIWIESDDEVVETADR
jgi:hypothetical protein